MVSAIRKNNSTIMFKITAGKSGKLRIKDNFNGKAPKWNIKNVNKIGGVYEIYLSKGQKLIAEF
jgi:alpha-L-fucosidase 2